MYSLTSPWAGSEGWTRPRASPVNRIVRLGLAAGPLVAATPGEAAASPEAASALPASSPSSATAGATAGAWASTAPTATPSPASPTRGSSATTTAAPGPGPCPTTAVLKVHLSELDGASTVTVKDTAGTHQVRAGQTFTPEPGAWRRSS